MGDIERKFETIRFNHNPHTEMLLRALEHVRHFIIQHKLILVGGMSIDCALRLRGSKLYDDDTVPDYDFYSPKSAEHAYLLSSELCDMDFPNVDVIAAIHTTTMRVRVDGNSVADITYMPPTVFTRLRTLEYSGVLIVHPWMVMMDQFRSLSTPYENPPNEVIFERWGKDVKRLNMLLQFYELDDKPVKFTLQEVKTFAMSDEKDFHWALQGWAALAHWENELLPSTDLRCERDKAMLPVDYCSVVTTDVEKAVVTTGAPEASIKRHNPLFSYPRHAKVAGFEIFDFWGERTTLHLTKPVVSLPSLMYYFLHTWLLRGDELSLEGARRTSALIRINRSALSIRPLGEHSWNMSTLYGIANLIDHNRVKNWKPQSQDFGGQKNGDTNTKDCSIRRSFNPEQSPLFAIDESECEFITIVSHDQLEIQ